MWAGLYSARLGVVLSRIQAFCISEARGFSLVELVVVMLVISILTVIAIPKFIGVQSQYDQVVAQELRSHLRYIQNLTMNRELTTRVIFNVALTNYTAWIDTTGTGTYVVVKDPLTQNDLVVNIAAKFPGVAFAVSNILGNTLYFSGTNGVPCDANGVMLTAGSIVFNSGLTLTVVPYTGYVDLQ